MINTAKDCDQINRHVAGLIVMALAVLWIAGAAFHGSLSIS